MRNNDHELSILQKLEIDILEGSFCDQVDRVRRAYRYLAGKRLRYKTAVEWVDLLHRHLREETAARPRTGFELSCPNCYGHEGDLVIELNDLSTVRCLRCMEEFTPESAHDTIAEALEPWNRFISRIAGLTRDSAVERLEDRLAEEIASRTPGCHCLVTGPA